MTVLEPYDPPVFDTGTPLLDVAAALATLDDALLPGCDRDERDR